MPRIAWKLTGRPIIFYVCSPRKSVHSLVQLDGFVKGDAREFGGDGADLLAGMPQRSATASGAYSGSRYFSAIRCKYRAVGDAVALRS